MYDSDSARTFECTAGSGLDGLENRRGGELGTNIVLMNEAILALERLAACDEVECL